jgi:hypothetical protein
MARWIASRDTVLSKGAHSASSDKAEKGLFVHTN